MRENVNTNWEELLSKFMQMTFAISEQWLKSASRKRRKKKHNKTIFAI